MKTSLFIVTSVSVALATAAVGLAKGGPGMMGPEHKTSVPSFLAYYDGHKDTFLATDTSSAKEAKAEHINFSPKLEGRGEDGRGAVHVRRDAGHRSAPRLQLRAGGDLVHAALARRDRDLEVGGYPGGRPHDDQVNDLQKKGMVRVRVTGTILNCPIVKVGKGGS
jgi:hypothetical protein